MSAIFFLKKYSHSSSHFVSKWLNCAEDRLATVESGTASAPPSTQLGVRYACQGQLPFWSTPYSSLQLLQKLIPCLHWNDLAKSLLHEASHGWKLGWPRNKETGTPLLSRLMPKRFKTLTVVVDHHQQSIKPLHQLHVQSLLCQYIQEDVPYL